MKWKQSEEVEAFIAHWSRAAISERAHYQTFIIQLCRLIGAPAPDDEQTGDLDYCFERPVRFRHDNGSTTMGWIDCAKRGCFVLEAKQSGKRRDGGPLDPTVQLALFARPAAKAKAPSLEALDRIMRTAKRQAENYARLWTNGRLSWSSWMSDGPSSFGPTSRSKARFTPHSLTAQGTASRWTSYAVLRFESGCAVSGPIQCRWTRRRDQQK